MKDLELDVDALVDHRPEILDEGGDLSLREQHDHQDKYPTKRLEQKLRAQLRRKGTYLGGSVKSYESLHRADTDRYELRVLALHSKRDRTDEILGMRSSCSIV